MAHQWPRRGGFVVGLNMTCEFTRRRECSAKSVAKMIFSWGATTKPTSASVTPKGRKVNFNGAQFERAITNPFDR